MSRRATRLGYLGTVLVLAVLLVLFGQPYLFCMLQLLLALGITQAVCIRRDARRLHFAVCGPGSCGAFAGGQICLSADGSVQRYAQRKPPV